VNKFGKFKIYLDTSVISHLDQPEKDAEHRYTHEFWDKAKAGEYDIFISAVVIREINRCEEAKREKLINLLNEIEFNNILITVEVDELANQIIERGILTKSSMEDCRHIAAAVVGNCDYLLSWNMKHLCNVFTNEGIRQITFSSGYKNIQIIPPSMLLGK
jgi:predicted nucleic acid-binding protein